MNASDAVRVYLRYMSRVPEQPYKFHDGGTIARDLNESVGIAPSQTRAALSALVLAGEVEVRGQRRAYRLKPRLLFGASGLVIAPVVSVVPNPRSLHGAMQYVVACPYCGEQHTHGAGNLGEPVEVGFGSRVPHCSGTGQPAEYDVRMLTASQAAVLLGYDDPDDIPLAQVAEVLDLDDLRARRSRARRHG